MCGWSRPPVATQLMVDPHASAGIAAIELIKKYFAGPQDLAWTDGANASAQKLWVRLGGEIAYLYSQDWQRVLQPARQAAQLLRRRRSLRTALLALAPICRSSQAPAPGYAGSAAQSIRCAAETTSPGTRTRTGHAAACATRERAKTSKVRSLAG